MPLINWRKEPKKELAEHVERKATIEIKASKEAREEVVAEAKRINKDLNKLIENNNFTVTLYIATGGKDPHHEETGGGA